MVGGGAGPGDTAALLQAFVGDAVVVVDRPGRRDPQLLEHLTRAREDELVSHSQALSQLAHHPGVGAHPAGRLLRLVVLDHPGLGIRHHALVLGPGGDGEDDVRVGRRLGEEEIELSVELQTVVTGLDRRVVGEGDEGVVADADQAADLLPLHLPDHFHHRGACRREFGLLDPPDLADLAPVLRVRDRPSAGQQVGLLAVLPAALAVALAGDGAVTGAGFTEVAGGRTQVDDGQAVLDALRMVLDAPSVPGHRPASAREGPGDLDDLGGGDAADVRGPLGGVGGDGGAHLVPAGGVLGEELLVGEPLADDDVQYGIEEGGVGAGLEGDVDVGGARDGRLARVDHDEGGTAVPGAPQVLGHDGEALPDVGPGDQQTVGEEDVGERIARPVDPEGELVGAGWRTPCTAWPL